MKKLITLIVFCLFITDSYGKQQKNKRKTNVSQSDYYNFVLFTNTKSIIININSEPLFEVPEKKNLLQIVFLEKPNTIFWQDNILQHDYG